MNLKTTLSLVGLCFVSAVLIFTASTNKSQAISKKHVHLEKRAEIKPIVDKEYIELENVVDGTFNYRTFYPNWISENEYLKRNSTTKDLVKVNIDTQEETIFFTPNDWVKSLSDSSFSVSSDQKYIAFTYNYTDLYTQNEQTFSLAVFEKDTGENVGDMPPGGIKRIRWAPVGHHLAYVYGFDLYIVLDFNETTPFRITESGEENLYSTGIPDRQIKFQITNDDASLWWSPDGNFLAFATVDYTNVNRFEFSVYNSYQYPEMVNIPYAKPGTPIYSTTVGMLNLTSFNTTELNPNIPTTWVNGYYLSSAVWRGNVFTATWKNRVQNHAIVENCPIKENFACSRGEEISTDGKGWLGNYDASDIFPTSNEDEYITVRSSDGFPHVIVYNVTDDTFSVRTSGKFEVTDAYYGYQAINFYDNINDWIYFTSTELESEPGKELPRIRHMWRVKGHGQDLTRTCITCQLNEMFKDRCNWVVPSFNKDGSFVVINCGGTVHDAPVSTLHKINATGDYDFVRVVENNDALKANLEKYYFRNAEFGTLQLPNVEGDWHYSLFTPPNFDPNKKYPLLVEVYSGPGFQEVQDRFYFSWKDYVASSKEVIVLRFDGRGTGFRGDDIRYMVYKKLGQFEPIDQISAVRILGEKYSYIDSSRTAIWGKSYGGYVTNLVVSEDPDNVFKCGYSVAPVTEWEMYNTGYTERYMLLPNDNPDGYRDSSVIKKAENYKKHQFSLFHGTRDDNVHFQHAAKLEKYLVDADVDFRAFFATDDDHTLRLVPNNYKNIFKMITQQMDHCFAL